MHSWMLMIGIQKKTSLKHCILKLKLITQRFVGDHSVIRKKALSQLNFKVATESILLKQKDLLISQIINLIMDIIDLYI